MSAGCVHSWMEGAVMGLRQAQLSNRQFRSALAALARGAASARSQLVEPIQDKEKLFQIMGTTTMSDVIFRLRSRPDLRKRVKKLSRLRNGIAHPDVQLLHDLEDFMGSYASSDAEVPSGNSSSTGDTRADEHCTEAVLFDISDPRQDAATQTELACADFASQTDEAQQDMAVQTDVVAISTPFVRSLAAGELAEVGDNVREQGAAHPDCWQLLQGMASVSASGVSGPYVVATSNEDFQWEGDALHAVRLRDRERSLLAVRATRRLAMRGCDVGDIVAVSNGIAEITRFGYGSYESEVRVVRGSEDRASWTAGRWVSRSSIQLLHVGMKLTTAQEIPLTDGRFLMRGVTGIVTSIAIDFIQLKFWDLDLSLVRDDFDSVQLVT